MANEFDPYREALVMEQATIWPEQFDDWEADRSPPGGSGAACGTEELRRLTYFRQQRAFAGRSRLLNRIWSVWRRGRIAVS